MTKIELTQNVLELADVERAPPSRPASVSAGETIFVLEDLVNDSEGLTDLFAFTSEDAAVEHLAHRVMERVLEERDPEDGDSSEERLELVRLYAEKDYDGILALLEESPTGLGLDLNMNIVPVTLRQHPTPAVVAEKDPDLIRAHLLEKGE